ncbi:MAG: lipopolysaccharide biosynthesis protein, partial [Actinomycetota bacterium]|nr:lipopolysaccharide biosynthesis protein [Actinomycetota bacterium]
RMTGTEARPPAPGGVPDGGTTGAGAHRIEAPTPAPVAAKPLGLPATRPEDGEGLAQQTKRGLAWGGSSRLYGQLLQFAASILLARLLTPRDFGLAATVYLFAGVASVLTEMGIGSSIVRKRVLRQVDLATAFWLSVFVGAALALLLAALSPLIASWYDAPELVVLMWLVALRFVLAQYVVPLGLLERSMRFATIARIDVLAFTLGAVAAVAAALAGFGYYSLAMSPLVQSVVQTVLFGWATRFVPRSFVDREAARELWAYSSSYTAANLVTYARTNADGLVVGRLLGQEQLGYYGRGLALVTLPLQQLNFVLRRVMLPTLTRLRDDPARLRAAYWSALGTIGLAVGTALAVLAACAQVLVPFIWGDQWTPAVPVIAWLALAGTFQVLHAPTSWLCQLAGRNDLLLRLTLASAALTVVALAIGIRGGIVGAAMALAAVGGLTLVPSLLLAAHLLDTRARSAVRRLVPGALSAAAAGGSAWAVGQAVEGLPAPVVLLVQGLVGLLAGAPAGLLADRLVRTGLLDAILTLLGRPRTA